MGNCVFYSFKDGNYHCGRSNHVIGDEDYVQKYCWGDCKKCPVLNSDVSADTFRDSSECIFYCMKNNDYYCKKACGYIGKDHVESCCWGYNYKKCAVYTDTISEEIEEAAKELETEEGTHSTPESTPTHTHKSSATPTTSEDSGAVSAIFAAIGAILGGILMLIWKILKLLPFWYPLVALVLSTMLMRVGPSTSSSSGSPSGGGAFAIITLVLLVLHIVLIVRCRKKTSKLKYWPTYVEFALVVLTYLATYGWPVVLFQIAWLVFDILANKKKKV